MLGKDDMVLLPYAEGIPIDVWYDFHLDAEQAAELVNCVVVYPEPNQLQIDIDSDEAYGIFNRRIEELPEFVPNSPNCVITTTVSKSGLPHRHITVTFPADRVFSTFERIAIQFALGSDPIRETLSLYRALRGDANPSRLFEPKS